MYPPKRTIRPQMDGYNRQPFRGKMPYGKMGQAMGRMGGMNQGGNAVTLSEDYVC